MLLETRYRRKDINFCDRALVNMCNWVIAEVIELIAIAQIMKLQRKTLIANIRSASLWGRTSSKPPENCDTAQCKLVVYRYNNDA
mmetsp:Transcript_86068/g.135144  ORF Transcript_86068/g.135144 Transcript_86068/m.135144 type:complete len:85 (+) Transcript_86068:818-1072(+)